MTSLRTEESIAPSFSSKALLTNMLHPAPFMTLRFGFMQGR